MRRLLAVAVVGAGLRQLVGRLSLRTEWLPAALTLSLSGVQLVFITYPLDGQHPHFGRGAVALAATAAIMVWHLEHVTAAAAGRRPRHGGWTVFVMGLVLAGALPLCGQLWLPMAYSAVLSALLVLRQPWTGAAVTGIFAAIVAAGWMLDGGLYWTTWYVIAAAFRAAAVFVLVRVLDSTRRLQQAELALASEAVQMERTLLHHEIEHRLGLALEDIVRQGRHALAQVDADRCAADIQHLLDTARHTLTQSRRLIHGDQSTSLHEELNAAATLLTAAGFQPHLRISGMTPEHPDPAQLRILRLATARVLQGARPGGEGVVDIAVDNGQVRLEVAAERDGRRPDGRIRR